MCKTEKFKKVLLGNSKIARVVPNSVYLDRIATLATDTDNDLKTARASIKKLPDGNLVRQHVASQLNNVEGESTACQNRANGDPPQVWKEMETVRGKAANWVVGAEHLAKSVQTDIDQVQRTVNDLRAKTNEMHRNRSEIQNDDAAQRLEKRISEYETQINEIFEKAAVDPAKALEDLDDLKGGIDLLLSGTETAKHATPRGNRKVSRETTKAVFDSLTAATSGTNNRLGKLLAKSDADPDGNGLTLQSQISAALNVFDDHFAKTPTNEMTEDERNAVERDNTAMRVTTMVNAMALRVVKQDDVNDPLLKPLVARSIIQEYGQELAASLANPGGKTLRKNDLEKQQKKAKEALKLAEALVGEDPILKVFTGKINGPDAVESVRRQAESAGVEPSKMFELQKQQLEMRLGDMTMKQLRDGRKKVDGTQSFILQDLYGELDAAGLERLVEYQKQKMLVTSNWADETTPKRRSEEDGDGIKFAPTGQQVHRVENDNETLGDLAQNYYGDRSQTDQLVALNKVIVWTEQVPQDKANAEATGNLQGKVPLVEERKHAPIKDFLSDKPLPKGAVLNIAGKSSILDQLEDYVAAWDGVKDESPTESEEALDAALRDLEAVAGRMDHKERQAQAKGMSDKLKPQVTSRALKGAAKGLLPPIKNEFRDLQRLTAEIKKLEAAEQNVLKTQPVDEDALKKLSAQIEERKTKLQEVGVDPNDQQSTLAELKEFGDLAETLAKTLAAKPKAGSRDKVEASTDYQRYAELRTKFQDPGYIPAPGLGQSHGLGGTLDNAVPFTKDSKRLKKELEQLNNAREAIKKLPLNTEVEKLKKELDDLAKDGGGTDAKAYEQKLQVVEQKLAELRDTTEFKKLTEIIDARREAIDEARVNDQDGAMNQNQHAHIRMLARWDEEEKEQFLKENGESVEDYVVGRIAKEVVKDEKKVTEAKAALEQAFKNISAMPLTITFRAENLFSSAEKDEPTHGSTYTSEVVYSRATADVADLVGRGVNVDTSAAVTGGNRTGWELLNQEETYEIKRDISLNTIAKTRYKDDKLAARILADNQETLDKASGGTWTDLDGNLPHGVVLKLPVGRGPNYLRWRTDKDDREAHLDRLPFPDQQIFGAANPNWEKTKGSMEKSTDDKVGSNYYGNAHFLLKDSVRNRLVFTVRGGESSTGGGKTSFQRKDFLMLFYDMVRERKDVDDFKANMKFMNSLLSIGKDDFVDASNSFEFHLYGGFDIRRDAEAIYIADIVDDEVRERIERFAQEHSIQVGDKPVGLPVKHDGKVTTVEL